MKGLDKEYDRVLVDLVGRLGFEVNPALYVVRRCISNQGGAPSGITYLDSNGGFVGASEVETGARPILSDI